LQASFTKQDPIWMIGTKRWGYSVGQVIEITRWKQEKREREYLERMHYHILNISHLPEKQGRTSLRELLDKDFFTPRYYECYLDQES